MADLDDVPGGVALEDPAAHWDAWRPAAAASRLRGVSAPWYVAGGWALDLHRGEQTRAHDDLEIAVPAPAFGEIRAALADCDFEAVGSGRVWPADSQAFGRTHQTWGSEPDPSRPRGLVYRIDVFREPVVAGRWACRRDERITLPYERVIRHDAAGIPYLVPQLVLLFKAKHARGKDQADFEAALPLLSPAEARWLRAALSRLHPGHEWIGVL